MDQELLIEITAVFGSALAGSGLAFLLNYMNEKKKTKEYEIQQSREFLYRLSTVHRRLFLYMEQNLKDDSGNLANEEIIWKNLPTGFVSVLPEGEKIDTKKISFCSRSNKNKEFLSGAYDFEMNINNLNKMFDKQESLIKIFEKRTKEYFQKNDENIENLNLEEMDFEKLLEKTLDFYTYNKLEQLSKKIIRTIRKLYVKACLIKEKHRNIMKDLYPNEKIIDYEFEFEKVESKNKKRPDLNVAHIKWK